MADSNPTAPPTPARGLNTFSRIVLLVAIYFVGGIIGKNSSFGGPDAFGEGNKLALVWPPSGIALAAILLFGYEFWPGVALGAVLFTFMQGTPFGFFTLGTAIGNTVGAIVSAYLLERLVRFKNPMESVKDVVGFIIVGCGMGTTVNACFTVISLVYEGKLEMAEFFQNMASWWVPNAMAGLVVTPAIITWASPSVVSWRTSRIIEACVCAILLVGATFASYSYFFQSFDSLKVTMAFLPLPVLIWGTMRFGPRGAATGNLVVSALSIYALLHGQGPFVVTPEKGAVVDALANADQKSLLLIGSYIGFLSITSLMLAAMTTQQLKAEIALRGTQNIFEVIANNVSDLIALTDASGKRVFNSKGYKQTLGDDPQALKGTQASEFIHPEDRDKVGEVFRETLRTGVGARCEYRFQLPDGKVRYIESQGNFVKGGEGELDMVVSISRDITERKLADERMRLLASAVESADDPVIITTGDLELPGPSIVFVNPAFTRVTGYTPEQAIGKTPRILHGEQTDKKVLADLKATLLKGQGFHAELVNYRADGSSFVNEFHIEPIRDSNGKTTHYLAVQRDISERKQIEEDLARARDSALQAARQKAEFLANMSHEIRTPMNGVLGMTNLLLRTPLNRQQQDFAKTIRTSADALLTIINDILDFSKIEAGKLTFEILDFDLAESVDSTLELMAEKAQTKSVELAGYVLPEVPFLLRGDIGRVRQILTNLVGNAIKFTEKGEVILRVSKESDTATHATIRFEVKDTGIGISPEAQSKLFQPFVQADGSTTRKFGGTGLGLAICRQLVNMMHGQIGLHSTMGKGSTFWFTAEFEKQPPGTEHPAKKGHELVDQRVLIVDDNATNREILRHMVASWGMRDGVANDAYQALDVLRRGLREGDPFQLAILDMQMPGMDGVQLAREVKKDPGLASLQMVLLTSLGQDIDAEMRAAGIRDCMSKPVKPSRLYDCLVNTVAAANAEAHRTAVRTTVPTVPTPVMGTSRLQATRILLAEDNTINQKVALLQLEEFGYHADAVANGLEAVEALGRIPYDIILMDCQMPEMDGYEATRTIRKGEQDRIKLNIAINPVYIIAMTAHAMQGDREKCLEAGMNDYISKPVGEEALAAAIERGKSARAAMSPKDQMMAETSAPTPASGAPAAAAPVPEPVHIAPVEPPAVDAKRLSKLGRGDVEKVFELVDIYLNQSEEMLVNLRTAINEGNAKQIEQLAHKWSGSSSTCGMVAIAPLLRQLEMNAREGKLTGSSSQLAQIEHQFKRTKEFLVEYRNSPTSA